MADYICPRCRSTEWIRLESLALDRQGHIVQGNDTGAFKCANCAQKVTANDEGEPIPVDTVATSTVARPRVISSVSHAERLGPNRSGARKRDTDTGV